MSSAPILGASGGHIFDIVAQGLKKHVFTAMLAQHVASELVRRLVRAIPEAQLLVSHIR